MLDRDAGGDREWADIVGRDAARLVRALGMIAYTDRAAALVARAVAIMPGGRSLQVKRPRNLSTWLRHRRAEITEHPPPHRRLDDRDVDRGEDGVEGGGELRVAVADQEPDASAGILEIHDQVAGCWVSQAPTPLLLDPVAGQPMR